VDAAPSPITPFTIDVPQAELDDLRDRLARTRRTPREVHDWSRGTQTDALDALLAHWAGPYDWRAAERRLNGLDADGAAVGGAGARRHVMVEVEGRRIHAMLAGTPGATPLVLIHGWPDGFWRFAGALPLLAERFELVVPSIPGYGFSERPSEPTGPAAVGELFAGLMSALRHERFGVHCGDIGSTIGEQLALRHPDRILGLHLGDAPLHRPRRLTPDELTDDDREWMARLTTWDANEAAYSRLQRTKPQTLAVALDDSPAALAAWILEKFHGWSETLDSFTLDDLCTNLTVYWVTRTAGSSVHYYYDNAQSDLGTGFVSAPTAFAQFPHDILPAPRSSVERWFNVQRFTQFERGGHFGPWEQPEPWAADVTAFFDLLRPVE
jgi:pimeloyl-ACP methyl ester carboxylesterase